MKETVLEAGRGEDNLWDFDITGDLDAADTIDFRAARRNEDLTDAAALIHKERTSGISDVDAAQGTFQVHLDPADTADLLDDEALIFHVVVRKADTSTDTTVAKGLVRLS